MRAFVRFVRRVDDFVAAKRGRKPESFSAHVADKRSVFCVIRHPLVDGESVFCFEYAMALVALVFGRVAALREISARVAFEGVVGFIRICRRWKIFVREVVVMVTAMDVLRMRVMIRPRLLWQPHVLW